jgi:hypothetical protein
VTSPRTRKVKHFHRLCPPALRRYHHNPASVLSCHLHHQGLDFRWNRRASWILQAFGTIELVGDELPSSEDGVGFGDTGDLCEHFAAQSLPDFGERATLGTAHSQSRRTLRSRKAILRGQRFVLQRQLLVNRTGHVRQQSNPFLFLIQTACITLRQIVLVFYPLGSRFSTNPLA